MGTGKKTEKTAVEEGALDYEDEIVGSDYSDEDEYIDNYRDKENINETIGNNGNNIEINKENINNLNINNKDKVVNLSQNGKIKDNKVNILLIIFSFDFLNIFEMNIFNK